MTAQRREPKRTITEQAKRKVTGFPFIVETSITYTPENRANPLKYRFQLYHETTGETLVRYDIHHGKSHHRHFLEEENVAEWQSLDTTIAAFERDIETVKAHFRKDKP